MRFIGLKHTKDEQEEWGLRMALNATQGQHNEVPKYQLRSTIGAFVFGAETSRQKTKAIYSI